MSERNSLNQIINNLTYSNNSKEKLNNKQKKNVRKLKKMEKKPQYGTNL